jgi:hypothetical protein
MARVQPRSSIYTLLPILATLIMCAGIAATWWRIHQYSRDHKAKAMPPPKPRQHPGLEGLEKLLEKPQERGAEEGKGTEKEKGPAEGEKAAGTEKGKAPGAEEKEKAPGAEKEKAPGAEGKEKAPGAEEKEKAPGAEKAPGVEKEKAPGAEKAPGDEPKPVEKKEEKKKPADEEEKK